MLFKSVQFRNQLKLVLRQTGFLIDSQLEKMGAAQAVNREWYSGTVNGSNRVFNGFETIC